MTHTGEQQAADAVDDKQPEEIVGGEIVNRAKTYWFMERLVTSPVVAKDGEQIADAGDFIFQGSLREDRDDMLSVVRFHEKKNPDDERRVIRVETRYYVEKITEEATD